MSWYKRVLGICDRDSLACAFFNLPDVYVPPGSAPPLIRAAHGLGALKEVQVCGGLLRGDGAAAYVEIAEKLRILTLMGWPRSATRNFNGLDSRTWSSRRLRV